jgi:hypothetical protein
MTVQPTLHAVPDITEARGLVARVIADAGPRWRTRAERKAERRHITLVTLEELHRETPVWDFRARRALHKAIVAHIGRGW